MQRAEKVGYFVLGAVTMVLLLLGWTQISNHRQTTLCSICGRPIHANTRVLMEEDGERKAVCCARCVITEAAQRKHKVRLLEVTDYASGARLKPEDAWFVDGSRKVVCDHDMPAMDQSKTAPQMAFDRCSPGAYAFAQRAAAEAFVRDNGGVVLRLADLRKEVPHD